MHTFPGLQPADLGRLSLREYKTLLNYSIKLLNYTNAMSGEYPFDEAVSVHELAAEFNERARAGRW